MIKIERTAVMNMDNAIRGMRNPMNSWAKSDSYSTHIENPQTLNTAPFQFFMGENDMKLAKQLAKGGSDDRKFLRQIFVSVDITAPLYWWKEYDTYKVATVANSTSTMHKIHSKEFTIDDLSHDQLVFNKRSMSCLQMVVDELNFWRDIYTNGGMVDNYDGTARIFEPKDKDAWYQMIQLLPSSYEQLRTCTLNYENLIGMYHARKNHKLYEWREFCKWIKTLPYFEAICLDGESNAE